MAEPLDAAMKRSPNPDPNEKLVKVFDSELESEAMIVKGLLESAGIDSDLTAAAMVQDMFPGLGGMIILVREEDADRSRKLIAEYRQPEPAREDDETAEIEIMEEPPK
jgi:Putative prokaryotic signal transducing protein